jgi:hypothetical protein
VRFLRRDTANADQTINPETGESESATSVENPNKNFTPGKGRATPKRREAEAKRRGPVAPPPRTTREALKRNKELRKQNPASKEERRSAAKDRRNRMMAGEEKFLLPRDRGPVKAYVRDLVDSRRNVLGLFMPLALLVVVGLFAPSVQIQQYVTLFTMAALLIMIIEGLFNGRRIAKLARIKFPHETIRGASIGWYSFVRASQIRKLRVPKPRVRPGDTLS